MATDTKSPGEKLSVTSKTTLTLKPRAETGVVRQSFSHGRSKAVVVEKVRKRTEEERRRHDEETKRKADEVAKKRFGEEEAARAKGARVITPEAEDDDRRPARRGVGAPRVPAAAPKAPRAGAPKQRGRLTLVTALSADEVRERSVASFRRRTQRMTGHRDDQNKEKLQREVTIPETITIQELANRMSERGVDVIKILMKQGHM